MAVMLDIDPTDFIYLETYVYSPKASRNIPIRLIYDTGAGQLALSKSFLFDNGFPVIVEKSELYTGNNVLETAIYEIKNFWLLGYSFGDVRVTAMNINGLDNLEETGFSEPSFPGYHGVIGFPFIQCFNTFIDFDNKVIKFEPREEYIKSFKRHLILKPNNYALIREMTHLHSLGIISNPLL